MELLKQLAGTWQFWAFLSALAAALTAIFAKLGVNVVHPDLATFVRTVVILVFAFFVVCLTGELKSISTLPVNAIGFLILSGLATGASWLCYFRALDLGKASLVASVDKLSVVLIALFALIFLGEGLGWRKRPGCC